MPKVDKVPAETTHGHPAFTFYVLTLVLSDRRKTYKIANNINIKYKIADTDYGPTAIVIDYTLGDLFAGIIVTGSLTWVILCKVQVQAYIFCL